MADATFFGAEEEEDTSASLSEPVFFDSSEEEDVASPGEQAPASRPQGESPIPLASEAEAKARGEMGITETAQRDYEAATGADAPKNPILAQIANMGLTVGGKLNANLQMQAAQRLASGGNYDDAQVDDLMDQMVYGGVKKVNDAVRAVPTVGMPGMLAASRPQNAGRVPNEIMRDWDATEGRRIADPEERRHARMQYAAQIAADFLKERTAVRQNAETELENRDVTHTANIVSRGLGMVGYSLPYFLGPVGIGLQLLEEGSANAVGYANDRHGFDDNGKFRLVAQGDDAGRAALAGFGTAGIETATEVVGGKIGGAVAKRLAKETVGRFPVAKVVGSKAAATPVGKAALAFGRGLASAFKWTSKKFHLENPVEENIEELESAWMNAITGWDRRASELVDPETGERTNPFGRFIDANIDFFKPSNVIELNEAMLITMGGGAFVGMMARRRAVKQVDNIIREHNLMTEKELKEASLEAKSEALDAWAHGLGEKETVAKIEKATGWVDRLADKIKGESGKFAGEVNALREKMAERDAYNTGAELDRLDIPHQKFNIPMRQDERGRNVPDFRQVVMANLETGESATSNAVYDESGIAIVDNEEGGDAAYTVVSADGRSSRDFPTLTQSVKFATAEKNRTALELARDQMKRQVIANEVEANYGGANVIDVRTPEEAVEAGKRLTGEDVSADPNFHPGRKGWRLKDGTILLVRDNLSSPNEVARLLRHEAVGHAEGMMQDRWFESDEESQIGRLRERNLEKTLEDGPVRERDVRRALRETVANVVQRRRHAPDMVDRGVGAIRAAMRKLGFDLKMNDTDLEVAVGRIEKSLRAGDGGVHESKDALSGINMEYREVAPADEAAEAGKGQENADETGSQPDEAPAQPEPDAKRPAGEEAPGDGTGGEAQGAEPGVGSSPERKPVAERTVVEKMTDAAPVEEVDVAGVVNDDARIPNFKEGANPETGEVEPLKGEPYDLVSNPIVVMEFKDGKKVVVTGRHRLALYKRAGRRKIAARVIREADGWTVDDAKTIDSIGNIIDEKGSAKDYVRYFDDARPSRDAADAGGFLARPKGRLAFGIYEGATADTRAAVDWEGSGSDGMISAEQAGIIAEAAPKGAHPRNAALQRILVARALKGLRGRKLEIFARMMAEEARRKGAGASADGGTQLDLFSSPEDQALLAAEERRADYRARRGREYRRVAETLRTAMSKGGRLDLNRGYAKELGITDPKDRRQLAAARDKAVERADYWENAVRLDDADRAEMDAELGAAEKQRTAQEASAPSEAGDAPLKAKNGMDLPSDGAGRPTAEVGARLTADDGSEWECVTSRGGDKRWWCNQGPRWTNDYGKTYHKGLKVGDRFTDEEFDGDKVPSNVHFLNQEIKEGHVWEVESIARDGSYNLKPVQAAAEAEKPKPATKADVSKTETTEKKPSGKEDEKPAQKPAENAPAGAPKKAQAPERPKAAKPVERKEAADAGVPPASVPIEDARRRVTVVTTDENGRPVRKSVTPEEAEAMGMVMSASTAGPAKGKERPSAANPKKPRVPSVRMKNAEEERKARAALDAIDFDTPELGADGTIVSGDEVRKTMPGYDRLDWSTHVDRTGYVGPRLEAQFQRLLKERKGKGNGTVAFLAGGNGAGKSTVAAKLGTPDFTIDSTLGNLDVAKRQIDAILANGQTPVIHFVYREPGQALEGIKGRVKNGGHIVSPLSFANSHVKSRENLRLLSEAYGDKLQIRIYDNSVAGAPKITLEQLEAKRKPDHAKLREEANYYLGHLRDRGTGFRDSQGGVAGSGAKGQPGQVDFDSPDFDYERFGRLVTGVGRLVDVLAENGHRDFRSLAQYIAEQDAAKYERARPVLQDVWNAVARQKGLPRISDGEAEACLGKKAEAQSPKTKSDAAVWKDASGRERTWPGFVSPSVLAPRVGLYVAVQTDDGAVKIGKVSKVEGENVEIGPHGDEEAQTFQVGAVIGVRDPAAPAKRARPAVPVGEVDFDSPELDSARREYDGVVARYTNADGSRKPGWMKAPNGKPTNLAERQWVQVRTPAFKKWFGDWERKATADAILGEEDIVVEKSILGMQPKEQRIAAKDIYDKLKNGDPVVTRDGRHVRFTSVGFKEIKSHSADPHTLAIVPILREVVSTAHYFGEGDPVVESGREMKYHLYARRVNLGDGSMVARIVLREDVNGNIFYDEESTSIEDIKEIQNPVTREPNTGGNSESPHAPHSIAEFFGGINPASVSKAVDANGEPLVVYHGSKSIFSVFDTDGRQGTKTENTGAFFTDRRRVAVGYGSSSYDVSKDDFADLDEFGSSSGGGVYPTFLNVRNPLSVDCNGNNWDDVYGERWRVYNEEGDVVFASGSESECEEYCKEHEDESLSWDRDDFGTTSTDDVIKHDVRNSEHDGAVFENVVDNHDNCELTSNVYVVLDPAQIKSATENAGAFDAANPDIRFDSPELDAPGVRSSVDIGDTLMERGRFDRLKNAIKAQTLPGNALILDKTAKPQEAARIFAENILGRTFNLAVGGDFTFNAGHFFRLVCSGKNGRKGFVDGFSSGERALAAILAGEVDSDRITGWEPGRARLVSLVPDLLTKPSVVLEKEDISQFVKRYDVGNGRTLTAVFRAFSDGRKILSFHPTDFRYGELKQYRVAYLDDAIETGTSPATAESNPEGLPSTPRIVPHQSPSAQGGAAKVTQEEDAAYLDAVRRGDMEAAQRLLKSAWERSGYSDDVSYKDAHAAPSAPVEAKDFRNAEALTEARNEGWDLNLWAVAKGITGQPDDFFSDSGPRLYGYDDAAGREAQESVAQTIDLIRAGVDNAKIIVYRAVPKSVKLDTLQSGGQWVSPSRTYAENHGRSRFGIGKYRVIREVVRADELWWDGNDAREWGYDDGRQYVYMNDENGKKLATVTYDGSGNVIPLGERFNPANPGIDFDSPELDPGGRAREVNTYARRYYERHKALNALSNPKPDSVIDAAEGRWSRFRRAVQDKNLVIRELEERLGVTDKRQSVYYAKDREFGLNEHQLGELQRRHVEPIFDALVESGVSQEAFDLYLIARHAPYRNALVKGRSGKENGSGMSDAEADRVIGDFRRLGMEGDLSRIADMVYAMNDEALQRLVDSGRLSQDDADGFRMSQADYVPLRTDMEDADRDVFNASTSGWRRNEFKAAAGRSSLADSPLAWSIVQAEQAVKASNANATRQVAAALVRHAEKIGKPIGEIIPAHRMQRRWALDVGGEVWTADALQDRPDIIFFKEDGKLKAIRMEPGANNLGLTFAKAVTDKDLVKFSKWFEWIPKLTRAMSAMRTQYVPTFILRNLKADTLETIINAWGERGLAGAASFAKRLLANEWKIRRDVRDYFRDGTARGWMKEFAENGGLTGGGMAAEGFSEAARRIRKTLAATRGGAARKVAAAIPGVISLLNARAEFGTRVGIYATLREEGVSVADAVSYARDATVNFNRRGYLTPYINSLFMFSNASIQGMGRAFKTMRSEHGCQVVAGMFVVGVVQGLLDYFFGDDDDREEKGLSNARNLSEHDKQGTLGIPLPGGTRLKWQVRNPWALPMYLGRKLVEIVVGWASPKDAAKDVASAVGGFVTEPVGGNGFDDISLTWQTFAPTLADPLVQWMTGRDFKGDVRLRRKFNDALPDAWNGRRNTPSAYKWVAKGLNALSGGNEFRAGAFDTSPENWQLLAETLLGGALADINRAAAAVSDAWDAARGAKPDQVLRDVPFVRDTLTNMPDVSRRYYERLDAYNADRTEYRGARGVDEQAAFVARHPWVVDERARALEKEVRDLGKMEQGLEKRGDEWTPVERTLAEQTDFRRQRLAKMAEFVRILETRPTGEVSAETRARLKSRDIDAGYRRERRAFLDAVAEYDKVRDDPDVESRAKRDILESMRTSNPLLKDAVRHELEDLMRGIGRRSASVQRRRGRGATDEELKDDLSGIEEEKAAVIDLIRKSR